MCSHGNRLYPGDPNEYTQYTSFNKKKKKKISPNYSKSAAMGFFSKGLKKETALVNEQLVFEPLKVYCISVFDALRFKMSMQIFHPNSLPFSEIKSQRFVPELL